MPYQHPLVVRYDDEGRADGLKETNYLVVSSISASDWVGLPVAGGGVAVSDAEVGQIYFREDAGTASGIPLPANNTSGYLNVSTNDAGVPFYSWGPGGAVTPYGTNVTSPATTVSVWTYQGLNDLFVTTGELNTALAAYAQTTALDAFVEIDDATAANQIYYKSGTDAAAGIVAPTINNTYLKYSTGEGGGFSWDTPAGVSPPVQSTTEASLWYFSGISGIAVSAVSAASGAFIGKAVFTGPRQVIYSTGANTPTVTNTGAANQVLAVDSGGTTVTWINSDQILAVIALDNRIDTIEANYVSSDEFDQLTTSAAQISAAVTTVDTTHVAYTDAQSDNAIYYRRTSSSASGIAPSTGYLRWDGSKYVWETPAGTGATTLDELNDVILTGEAINDILIYKEVGGTNYFVNSPLNDELINTAIITDILASSTALSSAITSVDTNHVAYLDVPVNYSIFYKINSTSAFGIDLPTSNNQPYVLQGTNNGGTVNYTWVTQTAGVVNLNDLADVNTDTVSNDQVLVYKIGGWTASSISSIDAYQNLQASTQDISTVVNTIFNNYATDTELTNSINALSTTISVNYASAVELQNLQASTASISAAVTNIINTYATDAELTSNINSLSTLIAATYASSTQLQNLQASTAQLSTAITTIDTDHVAYADAILSGIYYRSGNKTAAGIDLPTNNGVAYFLQAIQEGGNLTYSWGTPPGTVLVLNDLTDVVSVNPEQNAVLVRKSGTWVASSISTIDVFQNLQTSTQDISNVVNTINSNYVNTTQFNNLSTLISETYVSGTEFDQLVTSAAQISAAVNTISNNYITTAAANAAYVNVAGDTMTGDLFIDGANAVKFNSSLGGFSAVGNINLYSPTKFWYLTEGLSANDIFSYTNTTVGVSAPLNITDPGYNHQNTGAAYPVNVLAYLRQLDRLLYRHAENYNNPTNDDTTGHWALSGLRTKTLNLLSATDASALKDINYPTTPSNGQVLTWSSAVNAWINQNATGGVINLVDLADVAYGAGENPNIGDILTYVNGEWTNKPPDFATTNTAGLKFNVNTSATSGLDIDEGLLYYDENTKTLLLRSANQTDLRLGQEVSLRVINKTGTTLNIGTVVYVSGTFANMPAIALASASAEATTHKGMGVLKETLNDGDRGLMMLFGSLTGVDTSLFSVGDILYLGVTPGNLTNLYASAPSHPELIGSVIDVGSSGTILVHVQHGYEINELHNVSRTSASATGQVLVWNNTGGYYAPGSHNDLAGLTTGNPHTQYATLSGATFTGTISAPTVSATTYQNIPKQSRPVSINIDNPSANMIIPLFYGEGYITTINQINSVIIGGTSASWSIYQAADVSNPDDVGNTVLYDTEVTDSTTGGNTHPINVSFSEDWIVLVVKSVSGAVSKLHLTLFVS